MGMMTRRNVKRRVVKKTTPAISFEKEEINKQYTKTEINRMSTAELKQLAVEQGIENADDMTGGELKKVLIKKFCS